MSWNEPRTKSMLDLRKHLDTLHILTTQKREYLAKVTLDGKHANETGALFALDEPIKTFYSIDVNAFNEKIELMESHIDSLIKDLAVD